MQKVLLFNHPAAGSGGSQNLANARHILAKWFQLLGTFTISANITAATTIIH
jgi:hypothetical protein